MKIRRTHARGLLSLALFVAVVGCEPVESGDSFGGGADTFSAQQMMVTEDALSFRAVRQYNDYHGNPAGIHVEQVLLAPDGRHRVDLLSQDGKTLAELDDAVKIQEFLAKQKRFADAGAFPLRARGFRLRDPALFNANYTATLLNDQAVVAGRTCYLADVWPIANDRPHYTVWMDRETLVTLKYLEFLPTGELAAAMDTLEIEYSPDLTGESLVQDPPKTDISHAEAQSLATFPLRTPAYLPQGFVLTTVQVAYLNGRQVFTWSFTDGVQEIYLAQYASLPNAPVEVPTDYPAGAPHLFSCTATGAGLHGTYDFAGTQVHVRAKLHPAELTNFVESLFAGP